MNVVLRKIFSQYGQSVLLPTKITSASTLESILTEPVPFSKDFLFRQVSDFLLIKGGCMFNADFTH